VDHDDDDDDDDDGDLLPFLPMSPRCVAMPDV
jgi:hypothetical protein